MLRRLGLTLAAVVAATAITGTAAAAGAPAPPKVTNLVANVVTNVAHRGASAYAPENSIAAFKLAHRQRADVFELDVQETKDHKLVLMHDTTLGRTTNAEQVFPGRAPWNVRDFTLAEIRTLDAGSWKSPDYKGERVPTLGQSLRAMERTGLGLLLEIKAPELYPGVERRVAEELRRNPSWLRPDPRERRLVVQAFNWPSMQKFHRILPRIPIGLLGTPPAAQLPTLARFADQINPTYRDLNADYVKQVHRLRMEVFTWTLDDPADMRGAIALGVDGVITNKPDVLRTVINQRTQQAAA